MSSQAHRQALEVARQIQAAAEVARDAEAAELREARQSHQRELARRDAAAQAGQLTAAGDEFARATMALAATREALATANGDTRLQRGAAPKSPRRHTTTRYANGTRLGGTCTPPPPEQPAAPLD